MRAIATLDGWRGNERGARRDVAYGIANAQESIVYPV
jgi:hypothetical protein